MNAVFSKSVFTGVCYAELIGGEFPNCYGQGRTKIEAAISLRIRVNQLRQNLN